MRLLPSDPDIATIVARIRNKDIDLQPDFQRGEVWGKAKKQRLIDSILREWHVPPVHVIEDSISRRNEVLDGQQRLAAIRDFVDGKFPLDGNIEPSSSDLRELDGMHYGELPSDWKRRFDQFTIRLFRIVDYRPGEPGELFFRLNQPTSLTSAEQRNAFFGPVRKQIKDLVDQLIDAGVGKEYLGFSNSRMAYDDVLSRVALAIERKSLAEKITAADLADAYRSDTALKQETVDLLTATVATFAAVKLRHGEPRPRFNKATAFSWMLFLVRDKLHGAKPLDSEAFADFQGYFAGWQSATESEIDNRGLKIARNVSISTIFNIYHNRSTARVADVSSVLLRDASIWIVFDEFAREKKMLLPFDLATIHRALSGKQLPAGEDEFARALQDGGWGRLQ
jgi:hypothetical protein